MKARQTCPDCGAPATDHGGLTQCTADPEHIDVYDLTAIKGPVTLKRKPGIPEPPTRPDELTEGERMAVGWWARKHHPRWAGRARSLADAMRRQFSWFDDDDLTRIALYMGDILSPPHRNGWQDMNVTEWGQVMKAVSVELAHLELNDSVSGKGDEPS